MKTQVIDKLLPAEAVITAGNNNTNTAAVRPEPPGRPDPPGGVIMLPGTVTGAATVPKQEAAAAELADAGCKF